MPAISCRSLVFGLGVLWAGLALSSAAVQAENWPSWRGPTQNGVSTETGLPVEWDSRKSVAWWLPLPGRGGATPVIWGERIFLTSVDGQQEPLHGRDLLLVCVGTNGREQWRQTVARGNEIVRSDEGDYASPSPVTDGRHVWSMMSTGDLACYTVDGREVWKLDLERRYGRFNIQFGMHSTPVLHDGRLYLQLIHGDGRAETQEALVACVAAADGKEIWREDRVTAAHTENEHSYASPILYDFDGLTYLITHGADYTIAHNLDDGSERWRMGGLNPHDNALRRYHPTLRFVASPAAAEGIVVIPTAKRQGVWAIRPDLTGNLTRNQNAVEWLLDRGTPDVPSPLIHDDLVYLCGESGTLTCLERDTGEMVYGERLHHARYRASPVYVDGHVICTSRDGVMTVVKAGRTFEVASINRMEEETSASPAVSNGTLYLRTFDALYAVRKSSSAQ